MFVDGISFNSRGTTFKNENGIDIQKGIQKILNEYKDEGYITKDDLYGGYSNTDIKEMDLNVSEYEDIEFGGKIKKDIYKGEECYKIYISKIHGNDENTFVSMDFTDSDEDYFHIGHVPKEDIEELNKILSDERAVKYKVSIKIVGGKYKHSIYDDYEDKEKIETEVLTYGFEVTIYTDDGIKEKENKSEEIRESTIKQSESSKNSKKKDKVDNAIIIGMNIVKIIGIAIIAVPAILLFYGVFWIISHI